MNDKEYLFEAIGDIDDDLIDDAAAPKLKRRIWPLIAAVACASAVLIVILSGMIAQPDPVDPEQLHTTGRPDPDAPVKLYTAENLWLKDDFAAFSLSYTPTSEQSLSCEAANYGVCWLTDTTTLPTTGTPVLQTTPIVISGGQTMALEALVGRRYIVYMSEKGYPVFYDTQTDGFVDLQERILGDTDWIFLELMKDIELRAQQDYPGMLDSETNRSLLWYYLYYLTRGLPVDDLRMQKPDLDFMQHYSQYDEYKNRAESDQKTAFFEFCLDLYRDAERAKFDDQDYSLQLLGIDPIGGICIIRVSDISGDARYYAYYDIVTDTCTRLAETAQLETIYQTHGFEFSYSPDGGIAAALYPKGGTYSMNPLQDYVRRYEYPTYWIRIPDYQGEEICLYLLNDHNREIAVQGPLASSKVYYADDSSVIYYRMMPEDSKGKCGYFSDAVWYNRLNIVTDQNDQWAFYSLKNMEEMDSIFDPIILQGNVVRLAANNTVAIMERDGNYYAYSLEDGREVTQDIREDQISMYLHEQYICWLENGVLYRKNIFKDGQPEAVAAADVFLMSNDGAFAFAYCSGDTFVTCINVATLESCMIHIGDQLAEQFFTAENATIRITYTDQDNTLLLSFCVEEEAPEPLDFYSALKELPLFENYNVLPDDAVVITDLQVEDWVLEGYREGEERFADLLAQMNYSYYPEFAPRYMNPEDIFACLGLEKPEPFAHLQGTRYVLYDDGEESLVLEFYVGWGLFDYDHYVGGARVVYRKKHKVCQFLYVSEFAKPDENPEPPPVELPFDIPVELPKVDKP